MMPIKNTVGIATFALIGTVTLSSCTATQSNSDGWVCTGSTVKDSLSSEALNIAEDVPLTDQCFLQLTQEESVDANAVTLEAASTYREQLDEEEHAQMQQFANDYGVEIAYNKVNNSNNIDLNPLPGDFVASSTKDSKGQYFLASRSWQYTLNTSPLYSSSTPPTDLMEELHAGHLDGWFSSDAYMLREDEHNAITPEVLTKLLEDNAHQLVDNLRPHFEPTDITVKNGNMWYPAHITDGKLVILNNGDVTLDPLSGTRYHVTPGKEG